MFKKWPFMSHKFSDFFPKLKKNRKQKILCLFKLNFRYFKHFILVKYLMYLANKIPEMVVTWPTHNFVTFLTGQSLNNSD